MTDKTTSETASMATAEAQISRLMDRILGAAHTSAVFSPPVVAGDYTVITASQVSAGGGFGFGRGSGNSQVAEASVGPGGDLFGGGGGGGGAEGRPVAVIVVGPDGVTIKPVFDLTSIALAAITTWAAMATTLGKLRRATQD